MIRYVHAAHAAKQSNRGQVFQYFGERSADSAATEVDPRGFRFLTTAKEAKGLSGFQLF
jgi:hypothetical protein